jgi:hypothetical protein
LKGFRHVVGIAVGQALKFVQEENPMRSSVRPHEPNGHGLVKGGDLQLKLAREIDAVREPDPCSRPGDISQRALNFRRMPVEHDAPFQY